MNLHSTSPLLAIGGVALFVGAAGWLVHELLEDLRTGRFVNYIGMAVSRDRPPLWFRVVMTLKALAIGLLGYFAWLSFQALRRPGA